MLLVLAAVLLAGCTQTATVTPTPANAASPSPISAGLRAQAGDKVSVEYVGRLENGTVFDTNIREEAQKAGLPARPLYPYLTFVVGAGQMIPGFDKGVVGMAVGEKKTVTVPPEEAYGEWLEENVFFVPLANITAEGGAPRVGMRLFATNRVSGVVTAVNDTHATVDFNHELAGKTIVFDITMKDIKRQ